MNSNDGVSYPRYQFNATSRRIFHRIRGVRLDFYNEKIMVYQYNVGYLKGLYYSFLRTRNYSDVTRCKYVLPLVAERSVSDSRQANMKGGVEMWILESGSSGRRLSKHFWNIEKLHFESKDSTEAEIRQMYDWLCGRIQANGGNV